MKTLNKINDLVDSISSGISGALLFCMMVVTFVQVIIRLVKGSLPWSEETARYMQVYLSFLGLSVGVKRHKLISVEVLHQALPLPVQNVLNVIIDIFIGVVSAVLAVASINLSRVTMLQKSPVLGIPMGLIYLAVTIGSFLAVFHSVVNVLNGITGYQPEVKAEDAVETTQANEEDK
jgi:TRAP-type C4-dicarboxylate transport system permease small subunit